MSVCPVNQTAHGFSYFLPPGESQRVLEVALAANAHSATASVIINHRKLMLALLISRIRDLMCSELLQQANSGDFIYASVTSLC